MKSFLLTSNFCYSCKFLTGFSVLSVLSFYFELEKKKRKPNKPNHATTFFSFKLLETVISACVNMASVT